MGSPISPVRPFGLHHLQHWHRCPTGPREEMFCTVSPSTCTALRDSQESSPGRLRPSVSLHGSSHFMSVNCSTTVFSPPRGINTTAVQTEILLVTNPRREPPLLVQSLAQEPRESSRNPSHEATRSRLLDVIRSHLPLLSDPALVSRSVTDFDRPLHLTVTVSMYHPVIVESFVNRLYVKDSTSSVCSSHSR